MLFSEHTLDSAREAIRSCIADLKVVSGRLERGQSKQAKGAIEAACNKMRPDIVTLARDAQEARGNLEFFDCLLSSPIRNAEVIIALAEKLLSLAVCAQNAEQSKVQEARSKSFGGGLGEPRFEVAPSDAPAEATRRAVPVTSYSAGSSRETTESNAQSTQRRKRGRPTKIPTELKMKALTVHGGKARAKILFDTDRPTDRQVKDVSKILTYFTQKYQPDRS